MAAKIDFSTIRILELIVHDIPKHKKNEENSSSPTYSQKVSDLPDGLRFFFKDKLVQALSSEKALKVCYDEESTSPIKRIVGDLLNTDSPPFVKQSQEIAKHLFNIQTGSNAAGILLVITGEISGFKATIIMKLERDSGAQLNLDQNTQSFNIVEVKNLMLTQKTKIFKVALLIDRVHLKAQYDGVVTDYQISIKRKKEAITFFIDEFLGCKACEDPRIVTQKFYNLSRTFIDQIEDQVKKTKYLQDLNSYVQKNQTTLNPREFAEDYLITPEEKDRYKLFLQDEKFPYRVLVKDTQLIDHKVKKISVDFENDISIVGNQGTLDENVTIERYGEDGHRAEIISKIKRVS